MIQKVDDSFPVPVSGKPIQSGWFGTLVRFVNSLRLRGDGRYFMVSRNLGGTTIAPSNALIQALERSGGAAPSTGGGTYGMAANVSGGTAAVQLVPGGTSSSVSLIPGSNVTITGTTSSITISAAGGGSSVMTVPKYESGNWLSVFPGQYYYFPESNQVEWLYGSVMVSNWVEDNTAALGIAGIIIEPISSPHLYGEGRTFEMIDYPSYDVDNRYYPYRATFIFGIPPGYKFWLGTLDNGDLDLFKWEFMTSSTPEEYIQS